MAQLGRRWFTALEAAVLIVKKFDHETVDQKYLYVVILAYGSGSGSSLLRIVSNAGCRHGWANTLRELFEVTFDGESRVEGGFVGL